MIREYTHKKKRRANLVVKMQCVGATGNILIFLFGLILYWKIKPTIFASFLPPPTHPKQVPLNKYILEELSSSKSWFNNKNAMY